MALIATAVFAALVCVGDGVLRDTPYVHHLALLVVFAAVCLPYLLRKSTYTLNAPALFCAAALSLACIPLLSGALNLSLPLCAVGVCALFCLFLLFCLCLQGALRVHQPAAATTSPRAAFWPVFAVSAASLCGIWARYFPSETSGDVLNQWQQIHGEIPYTDVHAVAHTLFLKGLYTLWNSTGAAVLAHIVLISLLYACFARRFAARGGCVAAFACFVLLANTCLDAAYSTYMWPLKDTPYTICLGFLTLLLMRWADGEKTLSPFAAIGLGACLALAALLRYNGLVPAVLCGALFAVRLWKSRQLRALAVAALTALVLTAGVQLTARYALQVESPANGTSVHIFGSGIAAVVAKDGVLTPEQAAQIEALYPVDWMKKHYNDWSHPNLFWAEEPQDAQQLAALRAEGAEVYGGNTFMAALGLHKAETIRLYFSLLPRNLGLLLQDWLYNTVAYWGIGDVLFFQSHVFICMLLVLAAFTLLTRAQRRARWWIALPLLANLASVMVAAATNEDRYVLITFTLAPVLLADMLLQKKEPCHDGT